VWKFLKPPTFRSRGEPQDVFHPATVGRIVLGLSTYAFFWQHSAFVNKPVNILGMIEQTRAVGADVLQICDYPEIETLTSGELADIRAAAESNGVSLELGVRGVRLPRLEPVLSLANSLGAALVRTMLVLGDDRPTVAEAVQELRAAVRLYADSNVTLALETYEQVPTVDLLAIVEAVGDPHLGICLDPANVVARLENPRDTVDLCAERVVNLHVKDFQFERQSGLIGFVLTGCLLGSGQLDVEYLYQRVRPEQRGISQIVEHWLPWQADAETTLVKEKEWTAHSLSTVRRLVERQTQ
jgi:3-oxoisoapionate decarboxylase